jgi:hypothetical protein
MPLRDEFDEIDWWDCKDEVDRRLTAAIINQFGSPLGSGMIDELAIGFRELQAMRRGANPDYDKLGVALAYIFKFMPFRVSSAVAALVLLQRQARRMPLRVLDIGSGTDATRLAIDLCLMAPHRDVDGWREMRLVTLEGCKPMMALAQTIAVGPGLSSASILRSEGYFDFQKMDLVSSHDLRVLSPFVIFILYDVLVLIVCLNVCFYLW